MKHREGVKVELEQKAGRPAGSFERNDLRQQIYPEERRTEGLMVPESLPAPRRPLTRSQTGRVAKRRLEHEDEQPPQPAEPKNRVARLRKKRIELEYDSAFMSTSELVSEPAKLYSPSPRASPQRDPDSARDARSVSSELTRVPSNSTQMTFLDGSTTPPSSGTSVKMDISSLVKTRANLPTPVPNLTKKSRGRRVPTKLPSGDHTGDTMNSRIYVCQVENCGKCFHRGEHLKRHIRSIHTHEKPFKCTHPLCDKHFNRHDNLLQHLKVHKQIHEPSPASSEHAPGRKEMYSTFSGEGSFSKAKSHPVHVRRTPSPPQIPPPPPVHEPYYRPAFLTSTLARIVGTPSPPAHDVSKPLIQQSRLPIPNVMYQSRHAPSLSSTPSSGSLSGSAAFMTYSTYGSSALSEPTNFAVANMAVSSLRTELPQSPPRRGCEHLVSDERSRGRTADD